MTSTDTDPNQLDLLGSVESEVKADSEQEVPGTLPGLNLPGLDLPVEADNGSAPVGEPLSVRWAQSQQSGRLGRAALVGRGMGVGPDLEHLRKHHGAHVVLLVSSEPLPVGEEELGNLDLRHLRVETSGELDFDSVGQQARALATDLRVGRRTVISAADETQGAVVLAAALLAGGCGLDDSLEAVGPQPFQTEQLELLQTYARELGVALGSAESEAPIEDEREEGVELLEGAKPIVGDHELLEGEEEYYDENGHLDPEALPEGQQLFGEEGVYGEDSAEYDLVEDVLPEAQSSDAQSSDVQPTEEPVLAEVHSLFGEALVAEVEVKEASIPPEASVFGDLPELPELSDSLSLPDRPTPQQSGLFEAVVLPDSIPDPALPKKESETDRELPVDPALEDAVTDSAVTDSAVIKASRLGRHAQPSEELQRAIRSPRLSRFAGLVLGAAIGDAMGHPTEFLSSVEAIEERYGPGGVQGFELWIESEGGKVAPYTDDTQMAECVLRSLLAGRRQAWGLEETMVDLAQRFVTWSTEPQGGHRAPGDACLSGCKRLAEGIDWWQAGAPDAGGCGSVMRAYPVGLIFHQDLGRAESWAVAQSRLTHGDPIALAASAAMAVGVARVLRDESLSRVLSEMVGAACRYSPKTAAMMAQAIGEAQDGVGPDVTLERLQGWAAHEAIAAACYLFTRHPDDPRAAILEAANTPGDSDSLATLVGALVGARTGIAALPPAWVERLERSDALLRVALEAG